MAMPAESLEPFQGSPISDVDIQTARNLWSKMRNDSKLEDRDRVTLLGGFMAARSKGIDRPDEEHRHRSDEEHEVALSVREAYDRQATSSADDIEVLMDRYEEDYLMGFLDEVRLFAGNRDFMVALTRTLLVWLDQEARDL